VRFQRTVTASSRWLTVLAFCTADCSGTDAALDFPNEVQYAVTCAPRPIFVSTVNQGYLPATSVDAVNNTAQFTITMVRLRVSLRTWTTDSIASSLPD
jgi:hypothetical protein